MTESLWFSARLRFAVLTELGGLLRYMDSIRLIRAESFEHAFSRALEFGRSSEKEFKNANGERVAWRLASVESLDMLTAAFADGQEVYSEPVDSDGMSAIGFDTKFNPEMTVPTQTL